MVYWLYNNEKWLSILIQILNVIVSGSLTLYIIRQTHKLNEKQIEFELEQNSKQLEYQKRQIHLETYPYKREIYTHVFNVLELCNQFEKMISKIDLFKLPPTKIKEFLEILQNHYVPDTGKALWSMREAEYVLPSNISSVVIDIRKNYDSMCSNLMWADNYSKVLEENELEKLLKDEIKKSISIAIDCCKKINTHAKFIEEIMPRELDISNLTK